MALVARYLLDTSAAARMHHAAVADVVIPLISAGLVGTCAPLDFEALWSARSATDYESLRRDRRLAYELVPMPDERWSRVLEVQRLLARQARHRAVGLPDLLVAAAAEAERLTVLHHDADYDVLTQVMDVDARWVVPRGSV